MGIIVCLLLLVQSVCAKEIPVPESTSPDGRYIFYARGSGAIGTIPGLCMKNVKTDQVVTNLSSGGYVSEVEQAAGETKVLWSPDARWFAVCRRETKRTRGVSFYYMEKGQPLLVETPSYMQNVLGREGVVSRGRYWFEEPVGWGASESGNGWKINPFTLEAAGRLPDELIEKGRSSKLYSYRVVLRCSSGDHRASSVRLDSVEKVKRSGEEKVESEWKTSGTLIDQMRGISMQQPGIYHQPTPESEKREKIYHALRDMGTNAVPLLSSALNDNDVGTRRNAALVLIELNAPWSGKPRIDTTSAIPVLIKAMSDSDSTVRAWAAHAIEPMGASGAPAVPALIKLLSDPDEGCRNNSAIALRAIGAAARPALPALRENLSDPEENTRSFAQRAITEIEKTDPVLDAETQEQEAIEKDRGLEADDQYLYMRRKVSAVEPGLPEFTRDGIGGFSSSLGSFDMTVRYQPKENSSLSSQVLIEEFKKAFVNAGWLPEESTKSSRYIFRHRDTDAQSEALCVPYRGYFDDHLAERGYIDCYYVFRCRGEWMSASARLREELAGLEQNTVRARIKTAAPPREERNGQSPDDMKREKLEARLKSIEIPELVFSGVNIDSVAKFISKWSRSCDPEREGVQVVAREVDQSQTVTLHVKKPGMSVYKILSQVVEGNGLEFIIEPDSVVIRPKRGGNQR